MDAKIFRINYKSDFILTLNSDAGWMTPFCIKFWTGAPSQAFFVGWDGTTYTHCSYDPAEPTKLVVQFDDHHLPIGDLKFQVAYHFTVDDFPNDTEDEVINPMNVTTEIDGHEYQVMLDFTGETAPEIEFSLPAYANEAQRIANEQQRIANEQTRIASEEARIAQEETRQQNEETRIAQEEARVTEFARLKRESEQATTDANAAADLANEKAQLAAGKAALANEKAALAQQKAKYAQTQGNYAKDQGDYAKEQGDAALADHQRAEADHGIAVDDHTQAGNDHTRAEADHGIAADDHIQAGNDHTRAESDHTRAESDHAAVEVFVDSLGAFDISAYHATGGVLAKYADLAAALGIDGANIPEAIRKGGMSVKFIQSSDNKYVQFRCMANAFTTDTDYWVSAVEGFYIEPIDDEFIEMNVDSESKFISGRDKNGVLHENVGLNTPNIENKTYQNEAAEIKSIEREEYIDVVLDAEDKAVESTEKDGTKNFYGNVVFHGDSKFINDRNWDNVIKNVNHQWHKQTIISYKKPNTLVDNINNFDNLMTACLFAVEHASANNQFEIEVYENIYATEESDFTPIPDSPIHSGVYDYNALFYTKEYIRIRGIGSPKIISGRMKKAGFTTNRTFYQPGFYQGGELENLKVLAENVKYCVHYESNNDHNDIGINGIGYIRECEFIHYGGEAELWGNESSLYESWKAWGCGWIKGNLLVFDKCKLISYTSTAFSCHSNQSDIPVEIDFDSCHLIGADRGFSLESPLTSSDKFSAKLTNNYICGGNYDIVLLNGSAVNQTNVRIYGSNNTFKTFYGRSDKTYILNAVSTTDICRLVIDDAQVFGNNPVESDAEFGMPGYISGNSGGNGLNTRIGNCSVNSKQLSIQFGATLKTVVFNQDYTNVPVSDIIDYINTELSGFGTISEQRPADNYYPEFTDVVVYKKNNGNEIINFGDYVTISGMNVQKLPSSNGADAICIEKCGIGQIAKFRTNIN